jgi:hypothetical protein
MRYVVRMRSPNRLRSFPLSLLLACATLAGCTDDTKLEGTPVDLSVDGRTVTLQLGDCRVYKIERRWFRAPRKTKVLTTDFYLGFTVCTRQSLRKDGDYAIASLCRQAIGAGGGCASSGTYRSRDGEKWEKESNDGTWVPVESADVPPPGDAAPNAGGTPPRP